jgi:hypothetical protein
MACGLPGDAEGDHQVPSKLIELEGGVLIEIDKPTGEVQEISGGAADRIKDATIDRIKPIILKAAKPIAEVYKELNRDMEVRQAEVELGLGFEAEGNLYITKAKGNANLLVKLTLVPKQKSDND